MAIKRSSTRLAAQPIATVHNLFVMVSAPTHVVSSTRQAPGCNPIKEQGAAGAEELTPYEDCYEEDYQDTPELADGNYELVPTQGEEPAEGKVNLIEATPVPEDPTTY